jgi:hypothetical protein
MDKEEQEEETIQLAYENHVVKVLKDQDSAQLACTQVKQGDIIAYTEVVLANHDDVHAHYIICSGDNDQPDVMQFNTDIEQECNPLYIGQFINFTNDDNKVNCNFILHDIKTLPDQTHIDIKYPKHLFIIFSYTETEQYPIPNLGPGIFKHDEKSYIKIQASKNILKNDLLYLKTI